MSGVANVPFTAPATASRGRCRGTRRPTGPTPEELPISTTKGKDWWINFSASAFPDWFELYLGLEYGAARISSYDTIIPGLLQTREYAEALYRAGERRLTDDEIQTKVELRMTRQKILTRDEGALTSHEKHSPRSS